MWTFIPRVPGCSISVNAIWCVYNTPTAPRPTSVRATVSEAIRRSREFVPRKISSTIRARVSPPRLSQGSREDAKPLERQGCESLRALNHCRAGVKLSDCRYRILITFPGLIDAIAVLAAGARGARSLNRLVGPHRISRAIFRLDSVDRECSDLRLSERQSRPLPQLPEDVHSSILPSFRSGRSDNRG